GRVMAVRAAARGQVRGIVPADAAVAHRRAGLLGGELLGEQSHEAVAESVGILPSAAVGDGVADEQQRPGYGERGRRHAAILPERSVLEGRTTANELLGATSCSAPRAARRPSPIRGGPAGGLTASGDRKSVGSGKGGDRGGARGQVRR